MEMLGATLHKLESIGFLLAYWSAVMSQRVRFKGADSP